MRLSAITTQPLFGHRAPLFGHRAIVDVIGRPDTRTIDINGDTIPDTSHEELVGRLILAQHPDTEIRMHNARGGVLETNAVSNEALLDCINSILRNPEKPDAVNISLGSDVPVERLDEARRHFADFKAGKAEDTDNEMRLLVALEELTQQGVKVYVAAGNRGAGYFNLFSLAEGVITVGSTDAAGTVSDFSGTRATAHARGQFGVVEVEDGFDITGDGKADYRRDEVSAHTPLAKRLAGQTLTEAMMAYMPTFSRLPDRPQTPAEKYYKALMGLLTDLPNNPAFKIDADDRIIYDPDGSNPDGKKDIVQGLAATSFATPYKLGADLNARN